MKPLRTPFHRHRRRPLRPKPIRARHEVRLENRFQHELGRLLGHPVAHRGNPQRPLTALWFRDLHPTRRRRDDSDPHGGHGATHAACGPRRSPPPRQGDPIHPGRTPVRCAPAATPPTGRHPCRHGHTGRGNAAPKTAWPQPIARVAVVALSPARPPTAPRRLRQAMARRGCWTGQSRSCPHTYPLRTRDQSGGPSLPACLLTPISGTTTPSDSRCPPEISPSAYTPGLCPTQARQTGLSCSEPDCVHVPLPIPRKDPPS